MGLSAIEWTGRTWQFLAGCRHRSPGCANCYAERMANRLRGMALADLAAGRNPGRKRHYVDVVGEDGRWNGTVVPIPEAFEDPFRWRKPQLVFVNSMADTFHGDVPEGGLDHAFAVMALNQRHTFQVLTKRADRMRGYFSDPYRWALLEGTAQRIHAERTGENPSEWLAVNDLPNVWLGTSVEDQRRAEERIPHLVGTPAAVRFLSCEPLLGPLVMDLRGIDQVIVGGESGPGARPMAEDWVRSIRDQCLEAEVAFFFKQWGGVQKKRAGRELDGRTWDELPRCVAVA